MPSRDVVSPTVLLPCATLTGIAQVDHNSVTTSGAGAMKLDPASLVMSGSASIHHTAGKDIGAMPLERAVRGSRRGRRAESKEGAE